PEADSQYTILRSRGIQLAFLPHGLPDGTTPNFENFLLNDTPYSAHFTFQLSSKQQSQRQINGKLDSVSAFPLGQMPFGMLNDLPEARVEIWQITTQGTGKALRRTLKIRAKQFFSKVITAPILNKAVHHYVLFDSFDSQGPSEAHEDLKAYTRRHAPPLPQDGATASSRSRDLYEYASFDSEIDLHIEELTDKDIRRLHNAEILRIQLRAFDAYLDRALSVGVDRVFVIHGLGKGKLRNEIATRLLKHPEVKTFKNDYHPNYGYGATEVIFQRR
ncbi:MAG: Smr/MutS family protein, partial [Bacteroidota bacterium]